MILGYLFDGTSEDGTHNHVPNSLPIIIHPLISTISCQLYMAGDYSQRVNDFLGIHLNGRESLII